MAHHKSAIKRIKTNEAANLRNRSYKSKMRTIIKNLLALKEKAVAEMNLKSAYSLIDKLVTKGIIHKNQAANQKSRLSRHVNSIA
ncbi:30S ribosomal protein S20 [candidate division KSB1 bacterium]|nr:30S ribosomal protein S20 [candidate division KSB1 bacterium]